MAFEYRRTNCPGCGVKRERLDWLADNPRYTRRLVLAVGRRCRKSPLSDVAEEMNLDWKTCRQLDELYMTEQLQRVGEMQPEVIGIDELAIGPRHTYRIVVSDLLRRRPIWFGGEDRSEASIDLFFQALSKEKRAKIRLVVMDMWKAFRASVKKHVPHAAIVFDKFHVVTHLGKAMDEVRKQEYKRLEGAARKAIKGQKYLLLSREENLTEEGRENLNRLLSQNRRLYKAYLLKEQFGQLWSYSLAADAETFFANWRLSLRWQRLKPYEKFARMIERHWSGIVSYCDPANKVPLGFVEGLNNQIRALQRRGFGYRDEEYFRLKILTMMLPKL